MNLLSQEMSLSRENLSHFRQINIFAKINDSAGIDSLKLSPIPLKQ